MDKTKSKELFLHFLKTVRVDGKRLYRRWIRNYNVPEHTINGFFNQTHVNTYVNSAFVWDETIEGYYFWVRVNEKWRKYLEKYA